MSLETVNFEKLSLNSGDRVLDLGCGEGRHTISAYLQADVEVVGLDLSLSDLATAMSRLGEFVVEPAPNKVIHWISASGFSLPFADACFDTVICSEVLEHIDEFETVLGEIERVLKPGGTLAVSVPRFLPEWVCWRLSRAYHEVEGGHVRIFRTQQLKRAIERRRMRYRSRHWAHGLHSPYWWLRCLFWEQGETAWVVHAYHKLLVWDLMKQPRITRWLDKLLNPFIGKSVVMYFTRLAA